MSSEGHKPPDSNEDVCNDVEIGPELDQNSNLGVSMDQSIDKQERMIIEEPTVGMEFNTEHCAYIFYCKYAHKTGFSVRKYWVQKSADKTMVIRRTFCCKMQGKRGIDKRRKHVLYQHPITRVGCFAQLTYRLQPNGKYRLTSFTKEHNHAFAASPVKHMLRLSRRMTAAQKAQANDALKAGLSNKKTIDLMSIQAGGRRNLGFLDVDYKNYIYSKRKLEMKKGDAGAMLEYFQQMKLKDPSFFYSIQLDDDDLITNFFWADSRSIFDYGYLGDVVCFDTTYQTNQYGRPFAPFVGVNQHKQTIIFGGALLYDETTESFKWLFKTFLSAMSQKQPKTILTDQSAAMAKAIEEVFYESNHRLCVWHIYQNAAKHLSHAFHASKDFARDFSSCVYDYEEEDEWLSAWEDMLQRYHLTDNKWLQNIYQERHKWAMVYGRHMFTADMKSTQRSESMNNILKTYLESKYNLLQFFEHYTRLLEDRRYKESRSSFNMSQTSPVLIANVEMLRHAKEFYNPEALKMFQDEYIKAWDCIIHKKGKKEGISEYKVSYGTSRREHVVKYDTSTGVVSCSCMKFTFVGILCSHALKILDKKNIKTIPQCYLLKRWTKDAKGAEIMDNHGDGIQDNSKESMAKRYVYLGQDYREVVSLAAEEKNMCAHARHSLSKLLKELQEMKKEYCSDDLVIVTSMGSQSVPISEAQSIHSSNVNNCDYVQSIRGVKTKSTVGRPKKRLKDPLELRKKSKSRSKTLKVTSAMDGDLQQFGINIQQNTNNAVKSHELKISNQVDTCQISGQQPSSTFGYDIPNNNYWSQRQMTFTELLQCSMPVDGDEHDVGEKDTYRDRQS